MSEITRTTKLKIDLDLDVARRTVATWTDACNFISQVAFESGRLPNAVRLQSLVYADLRADYGLSSQIVISAIRTVASKYAALRTAKKTPKQPVVFRNQAVMLQGGKRGRDFSFQEHGLSISTLDGRIKGIAFWGGPKLPEYFADWNLGDARLFIRKNNVFLAVSFKREVEPATKPNDAVIGVDRGINYLAVATDGKKAQFFGGGHTKHLRSRYTKTRASLQQKKAQRNTRSVRRALKRLSGREARFQKDVNHVVGKKIVEFAERTGNPTIAIEDLKGIRNGRKLRKKQHADLNRWAFYQLEQFIRYKAETKGFDVIAVEARNTSKGCSECGYVDNANRNRHDFTCKACNYKLHADLNASRNVRLRGILARQELCQDGPPSVGPKARSDDSGSKPDEGTGKPHGFNPCGD